ncbi:hypothetical protein D6D01_02392 [Aureobasidium pullulans]|uniref:BTB domain-containing protein n=1 Tax=Aureobasidium pullulans TaxID=5580 RepID=A0A4S9LUA8_AURPU|nr:hypothetical protein D6D01_02392 [Aureobasidium pullulans]
MSPSSSPKSKSLSSTKFLYSPMITVRVGPKRQKFCIHKGVLCSNSEYFTKALSGQFKEAKTNIIELDDINVMLFKILVAWLYTGKLTYESSDQDVSARNEFEELVTELEDSYTNAAAEDEDEDKIEDDQGNAFIDDLTNFDREDPQTWTYLILCALFVLADRLDIPKLKVSALDAMIGRVELPRPPPDARAVLYTYEHTTKKSQLRRLLVHIVAYRMAFRRSSNVWNNWPPEFLAAVMVTNGRRLPAVQWCGDCFQKAIDANSIRKRIISDVSHDSDMAPFERDPCMYHEHKDEEEKKACRSEREAESDESDSE